MHLPSVHHDMARRLLYHSCRWALSRGIVHEVHQDLEGKTMTTRRIASVLIAAVVGLVALAPLHGAAMPDVDGLDPLPVYGAVVPTGAFAGTLRILACTLDAAGQLRLTGVLNGIATQPSGVSIPVTQEPFSVPATLHEPEHTTDVVVLALAPIALDPVGGQIELSPITVEIETIPQVGDELATRLSPP